MSATNGVGTGLASNASNTIEAVSVAEQDVSPGSSASPTGTATTPTIGLGPSTTLSAQAIGAGTLDIGSYPSDPVPSLPGATAFFDVAVAPGSTFGDVTFQACGITVNTSLEWWNPDAQGSVPVSAQSTPDSSPVCATGAATATTSPSVSQLGGTVFALVSFSVPPGSVTVSGPATVDLGSTYAASAAAPGAVPAPTYALAAGAPSWLAIDPSSGAVSGTVPGGITSFSYGVTAANSAGSATSAQQSVIVDSAPGPVSVSGPSSVTVGTAYAAVATSSGAAPGPTYALAAGAPPWLAINPLTGAIGGAVPEGLASFSYVVTATNTVASSVSSAQTVTVTPGSTSLALSPSPAPSVGVGSAVTYTATVTETAGSGPLSGTVSFTENGGAVAGCSSLALSGGVTSCTLTFASAGSDTVAATYGSDPNFSGSTASLSQSVTGASAKPKFTSASSATAVAGTAFSFTLTATGTPTPAISEIGTLPTGLSFIPGVGGTATVLGTPSATSGGQYRFTVTATNVSGTAAETFTLTVDQPRPSPRPPRRPRRWARR